MRILYDSKSLNHKSPFGCVIPTQKVWICIHVPRHCLAHCVEVHISGEEELVFPLSKTDFRDDYDIFSGNISFDKCGLYFYKFRILSPTGDFDLFKEGESDTNMCVGDLWQISCIPSDYRTPEPFWGKVMYQIFPDRFNKSGQCDLTDKLTPYFVHQSEKEMPCYEKNSEGRILNNDFFGGNFKGIEEKLDYIHSLGVGVIYLNPIFKAFSNHRYDTCDYKKCDPMLGNEKDFVSLCQSAHKLGIKIILDGVFSHTGADSIYFDAQCRFGTGVCSNPDSLFKSWYRLTENGEYESWWGIDTLPNVNEMQKSYIEYIITGEDSVIRHWLSLGADGFRLDVADELPDEFIYLFRREVKKIKADAIVIGEVWEDASNKIAYEIRRRYFTDGELDSVMNYPFRDAVINLCNGSLSPRNFADRIMTVCENYPKEVLCCLMNSLSTHDTPRILTALSGAPMSMTREECAGYVMTEAEKNRAKDRIHPAVFLMFVLPGCPCIYYGDERGMFGFGDPFNRGYMDWENCNRKIFEFYKEMAEIRNRSLPLQRGETRVYCPNDHSLCVERSCNGKRVRAYMNFFGEALEVEKGEVITAKNVSVYGNRIFVECGGFVLL